MPQLLTVIVLLVVSLVVFIYDLLTLDNSDTWSGTMTGFYQEQLGRLLIGFSVPLIILLAMLVGAVSDRNRGRK